MSPRSGRRPGDVDTRGEIMDAARALFTSQGYDATSLRAIAREAGVDPALVHHYFDDKGAVFTAAMQLPFDPADLAVQALEGPEDGLGERVVRLFLQVWASPMGQPLIALLRSATVNDEAARMLREFMSATILTAVSERLEVDRPRLRAEMCASQIVGLGLLRQVLGFPTLQATEEEELVAWVAPTLQRYLTGTIQEVEEGREAR